MKKTTILFIALFFMAVSSACAQDTPKAEDKLPWWPTDAQPAPVKDEERGGFWWWPSKPGTTKELWGNRGYAYVNKIVYDWRGGEAMKNVQVKISDVGFTGTEDKPSLMINRIIRNQKLQFQDNGVELKPEHADLLKKTAGSLKRNDEASVLITAVSDTPEGSARTLAVQKFFMDQGISKERIKVMAPEKFQQAGLSAKQASPPGTILFIIAEVKEVMIPGPK